MSRLRTLGATVAAATTFLAASLVAAPSASALPAGFTVTEGQCNYRVTTTGFTQTLDLVNTSGASCVMRTFVPFNVGLAETVNIGPHIRLEVFDAVSIWGVVNLAPGSSLEGVQPPSDPIATTIGSAAVVNLDGGTLIFNGPTSGQGLLRVTNGGEVRVTDDPQSSVRGTLVNGGVIQLHESTLTVGANNSMTNQGAVALQMGSVLTIAEGGSVRNEGEIAYDCTSRVEGAMTGTQPTTPTECVTDTTPPVVAPTVTGTTGAHGWYVSDVSVQWAVDESESAIASQECPAGSVTADTTGEVFSCTATSAGGTTTDSVTIRRDATPPVVIWGAGGPADGVTYPAGGVPAAPTCAATDATSGVDPSGCVITGYSTASGSHILTARAVDNADNPTSLTRSYSVLGAPATGASGFLNPVSMTSVNVVKGGSTVRLAFEVFADGVEVTDPAAVTLTRTPSTACPNAQPVPSGSAPQTTTVHYDSKRGVFLDTWKTPRSPGTCWDITVSSGSMSFTALYQLK